MTGSGQTHQSMTGRGQTHQAMTGGGQTHGAIRVEEQRYKGDKQVQSIAKESPLVLLVLYHKVMKHKYLTSVPASHMSVVLFLSLIGPLASMSTMCQCTPIPTSSSVPGNEASVNGDTVPRPPFQLVLLAVQTASNQSCGGGLGTMLEISSSL